MGRGRASISDAFLSRSFKARAIIRRTALSGSAFAMRYRFCVLMLFAQALVCAAQTKRALLIGIDTYQPPGTTAEHPAGCAYGRCELGSFQNLEGAVNDAQSMADLLTSPKFGFPADKVILLTNPTPPQPAPGVVI